ncbi:hypothetical protein SMICM17S_06568 [Streptomyces microflavus]
MEVEERVGNGFQLPGDPVGRTVTGCGEEDAGVVGEKIEEGAGGGFGGGEGVAAACARGSAPLCAA